MKQLKTAILGASLALTIVFILIFVSSSTSGYTVTMNTNHYGEWIFEMIVLCLILVGQGWLWIESIRGKKIGDDER